MLYTTRKPTAAVLSAPRPARPDRRAAPRDYGLVTPRLWTAPAPLQLRSGAVLPEWTLAYETYGALSPARDNAVLIMHALSGDAHVAGRHAAADRKPGWWDALVGPGKVLDTEQFFVICANVLGGCRGSTGPGSLNPATGAPYRLHFPVLTIHDMVAAQAQLLITSASRSSTP